MTADLSYWVDGVPGATLRLPDRGLEFGDGLYETLAVVNGGVRLRDRHLARLARGCERLGIPRLDEALLRAELAAAACVHGAGVVKLIVTRGPGGHGYAPVASAMPTRIVTASAPRARPESWWNDGVAVRRCALRLATQPALAGLKHLNRLEQVLARAEWHDPGIAEGVLLDVHDHVVCGTMTNVFAVLDDVAVTPSLGRAGVAGVMREALLDALPRVGVAVAVRDLSWDAVARASEVFVTNALIGAWPVRELDGRRLAVGPVVRRAQALVAEW